MGEQRRKNRRYPRVAVGTKIKGQTHGIERGSVLNFSVGGALIEHAKVRCRVVWLAAHRTERQLNGEEELIYRTGVEFVGPPVETR